MKRHGRIVQDDMSKKEAIWWGVAIALTCGLATPFMVARLRLIRRHATIYIEEA